MSATDILIVCGLIVFVVVLLRAHAVLRKNPYQQLKSHEELAGRLPANMSTAEKLRLINLFGVSPNSPRRPWLLVLVAVALILYMAWLS